ncbi:MULTISPECIES: hypothetical protein [unclassified Campylobacter]|uniref:hypothetical protein n=1 Tax=unclassified Campylobacter TaxID=2593542 RepID=UPI00123830B3|nr:MULTISPECIES: hypothetical protein [unclassified Campylobacter]KAA6226380.1 hypothetical protein FMM57_06245 [Campylobacter sp. LR286c]KAA6226582.1 hypothetical protein FMM54_03990 [Campylobacter sp. LR185c]KAA6230309.1 hypothetical protein FMM58_06445 [Campylobacter sp. LR291e]KAA6233830.1 hypothetical protein FMM56_02665 [Campylobacter sp. LR264d]KAA8603612.1 hypothetical protein CGP82_06370 [Campylobacter sp. LR185c]
MSNILNKIYASDFGVYKGKSYLVIDKYSKERLCLRKVFEECYINENEFNELHNKMETNYKNMTYRELKPLYINAKKARTNKLFLIIGA